jgi:hypothetical protein
MTPRKRPEACAKEWNEGMADPTAQSQGLLRSTMHRVVAPPGAKRVRNGILYLLRPYQAAQVLLSWACHVVSLDYAEGVRMLCVAVLIVCSVNYFSWC